MLLKNSLRFAQNKRTQVIVWFLLLSLLIHLIIADLFFEYGFQRRMANLVQEIAKNFTPEEQQANAEQKKQRQQALIEAFKAFQPAKKQKRLAKLVARKGQFGWTLFDEPPATKHVHRRQEIPSITEGDVAIAPAAHATEDASQVQLTNEAEDATSLSHPSGAPFDQLRKSEFASTINQTPPWGTDVSEQLTSEQAIPPTAATTKARFPDLDSVETMVRQTTTPPVAQKNIDIAERLINKGAAQPLQEITTAQRIEQIDRMTEIIMQGKMLSLKQPTAATAATGPRKGAGPRRTLVRGARFDEASDGKPRSIIALTKGFIEKLDGEDGNDLIDRDGDPNIQPDLEDIKLISYESKLFWCLQAAWNQNFKYRPDLNFPEGIAYIDYTVDRCGKLVACNLIQSTGHQGLDSAILKTFKIATPFPPFPSSFETETYRSGQRISVHHQRYGF